MALPAHHPFWAALLVTLAVAVLSSALVYARADRIVSDLTAAAFDRRRLRRAAAAGIAGSALLFGGAVSGLFLAMETQRSDLAIGLYRIASVTAAILLSLAAVRLRARAGLRGVPELVALNLIWATGFGWVMPVLAREPVDFTPPTLVEAVRSAERTGASARLLGSCRLSLSWPSRSAEVHGPPGRRSAKLRHRGGTSPAASASGLFAHARGADGCRS